MHTESYPLPLISQRYGKVFPVTLANALTLPQPHPQKPYGITITIKRSGVFIPKQVIFHDPATIVYWNDGTKTVVKCSEGDEFNPEKGFLHAYFLKHCGLTKTQISKYFRELNEQANPTEETE